MNERSVEEEVIVQAIRLVVTCLEMVIVAYAMKSMFSPTAKEDLKRVLQIQPKQKSREELEKEALRQVQREISWMEHGDAS